ncbi:BTAD domain-containing putative transcriptional regulator [Nocardia otitidiscaviarum]|uniref:BTAD domain-containing putative transcriptional regulator n=1 Tax=Nocardia otitidiscaviarum TaxID=1823 RepID=UPI0006938299|nr:BTAD domain-containing putative transcriptional regulator [Nocardia otitidiscaviarum]
MALTFGVLGPLWAEDERGRLPLKGPRHRAVLARLLVARGRVVPVARLIDDLWDDPPEQAVGAIQTFVAALRRALEPDRPPRRPARVLVTEPPGYALRIDPAQVDAGRFELAVRAGGDLLDAGDATGAATTIDAALALWRGPAYAEFAEFPWARAEINRLDDLRLLAVEQRARAHIDSGDPTAAVAALEAHLHEHPLRERAWWLLALALYRGGRQADALTALRTVRERLRDELGVDPGPDLRDLEAAMLAQDPSLEPRHTQNDSAAASPRHGKPERVSTTMAAPTAARGMAAAAEGGTSPESAAGGGTSLGSAAGGEKSPESADRVDATAASGPDAPARMSSAASGSASGIGEAATEAGMPVAQHFSKRFFLGRAAELERLERTAAAAIARGSSELVLISGMEGAGKTALAEAFSATLAARGWTTAWGPSPAGRGVPPNWAWRRIMTELAAAGGSPVGGADAMAGSNAVGEVGEAGRANVADGADAGGEADAAGEVGSANVAGAANVAGEAGGANMASGTDVVGGADVASKANVVGMGNVAGRGNVVGGANTAGRAGGANVVGGADAVGRTKVAGAADVVGVADVVGGAVAADPAVARFAVRERTLELVRAVARRAPVALVFDDLHQAGEETLELVSALVTERVGGPVLVIGGYRDTEVGDALRDGLARWARVEPERIPLGGLSESETGALARAVAGEAVDGWLARRIHRRGNGNPFFTRELARLAADAGEVALREIPAGVRDVVRQRLSRLPEAERTVLRRAAVLGVPVDQQAVTALVGDDAAVLDALDAGLRDGFLVETSDGGVSFAHAVVRDVLYDEIGAPRRAAWHAEAGEYLERRGTSEPAELADHFVRAGGRVGGARTARYALAAARAAERAFAPHEAARWFAAAAIACDRDGDTRGSLEATLGLGRATALTGDLAESRRLRAQAVRAADRFDDPELTARVITAFDVPALWTDTDDPELARQVVTIAERILPRLPDSGAGASVDRSDIAALRARLLTTIALELRAADSARGRAAAAEAERIARRLDDPALLAFALNGRFMQSFHRVGLAPERARIADELITVSQAHELVSFEVLGHLIAVQSFSATADFAAADAHAAAADALGEKYGLRLVAFFTRWYATLRDALTLPPADAEAAYRATAAAHPGAAMPGLRHGLLPLALLCVRLRHDLPLDTDPGQDFGPHEPWVRPLLLLGQHREDAARSALHAAPAPPPDLLLELRLCLLARAARDLGEHTLLATLRDRLAPAAGELAGAGTGLLTLGPVANFLGDPEVGGDRP